MRIAIVLLLVCFCGASKPSKSKPKGSIQTKNKTYITDQGVISGYLQKQGNITSLRDGNGRASGYIHRPFNGNRVYFYDKSGRVGSAWIQPSHSSR